MLSSRVFAESAFLQVAEEEPAFKLQLALYAEYGAEVCDVFDSLEGLPGERGKSSDWSPGDGEVRAVVGDFHDCLMADAELRAGLLDENVAPWVGDFLEDREKFVDLFVLGHLVSDGVGSFLTELEDWLAEICP